MPRGYYRPELDEHTRSHERRALKRALNARDDAEFELWVRASSAVRDGILPVEEVCMLLGISQATFFRKQIRELSLPE